MAATIETARQVQEVADQRYKYGFVTDIESETAPKESRTGLAAGMAAQGL
jgi:hypothetical protein